MANTVRVIKSGGVWIVKRDGNTKSSGNFVTQKEAYLKAREIALNNGLTITVYYPTGGIQKVITPKEKPSDDGCFITTACVKYYNLNDNCYELQTLSAAATIGPQLFSSIKGMWVLGLTILISYIITAIFYQHYVLSVWCFFSSIISISIYAIIVGLKNKSKNNSLSDPISAS